MPAATSLFSWIWPGVSYDSTIWKWTKQQVIFYPTKHEIINLPELLLDEKAFKSNNKNEWSPEKFGTWKPSDCFNGKAALELSIKSNVNNNNE